MSTAQLPPGILNAIIQGIVDQLRIPFVYVIVNVAFAGALLPMLIALFYFAHKRTFPVFICAVVSVLFALLQGTAIAGTTVRDVLNPLTPNPPGVQVINSLVVGLSILSVDVLLLCRVFAVVPPSMTPVPMLIAVYTFPILSKVVRLALIIVSAVYASRASLTVFTEFDTSKVQVQVYQSIWFITAFDNAYASAIFLWKLKDSAFASHDIMRFTNDQGDSPTSRIRTLFWLCGTNFVFPVPLYIAQLVLLRTRPESTAYVLVTIINNYVATICGVFATVWSTGISRSGKAEHDTKASSLHFRNVDVRMRGPYTSSITRDVELSPKAQDILSAYGSSQERDASLSTKHHEDLTQMETTSGNNL